MGAVFAADPTALRVDWSPDHAPATPVHTQAGGGAVSVVAPRTIEVLGTVRPKPELQARVFSPIWGRVEFADRPLGVGDRVKKGQALARVILDLPASERYLMLVRADEIRTELAQATTRRQQIELQHRQAVETLKGSPEDAFWRQEVQSTERILKVSIQEEDLLKRQVGAYENVMKRRDPRITPVEAPIGGTITAVAFTQGQLNPTGEFLELATITDLSRVWIEADVFEADLGRVLEAHQASFEPVPAGTMPSRPLGRPAAVAGAVDARNRTVRLVYDAANPRGDLHLGMSVKVTYTLE
jgi:cobalt-zinc-cadmium efflux system membrane fusion protein